MPTITIDLSYFSELLAIAGRSPYLAMWIIFKSGGWVVLLFLGYHAFRWWYFDTIRSKWVRKQKFVILSVDVPKNNEQSPKAVENIFAHLYGIKSSITAKDKYIEGKFQLSVSFEIVSFGGDIRFFIKTPRKYKDLMESAIYSQYPDAQVTETEDYIDKIPTNYPNEKYEMFGCDFKLDKDEIYPIKTYIQFEHGLTGEFKDPMSIILETLSNIKKDEFLGLQILVTPLGDKWREKGDKKLRKMLGQEVPEKLGIIGGLVNFLTELVGEFIGFLAGGAGDEKKPDRESNAFKMLAMSPGERKVIEGIEIKLSKVGFPSKIRYLYLSPHEIFQNKYSHVKGFLKQFAALNSNSFSVVRQTMPKKDYFFHRWVRGSKQRMLAKGYRNRDGSIGGPRYVLNTEELATIWHFPVLEVKAPLVKKAEAKKGEPPRGLPVR